MFSRSTFEERSATHATRRLTIALKILLFAAIATAPLYLVGENFDLSHIWRVILTNGESIHINVVNFSLVLVLAHFLLHRDGAIVATAACLLTMTAIAYHQSVIENPSNTQEIFVGTVVQFLPQFILIAFLLRLMYRNE